jgi:peptidoglycan biosynthesis protein MviN/MurJ (putative lipid II flippase)
VDDVVQSVELNPVTLNVSTITSTQPPTSPEITPEKTKLNIGIIIGACAGVILLFIGIVIFIRGKPKRNGYRSLDSSLDSLNTHL